MPANDPLLSIGQAATTCGVPAPTIRYYEEIGLIPPARRSAAGHRHYEPDDIARLTFIRRCRDFGFGIAQVRLLCGLATSPAEDCTAVRDIAADHLSSVRQKLDELRGLEAQLSAFVDSCESVCCGGQSRDCTVLADLAKA
ncbi:MULTISPECIES: MerR family transcriptional regulator [Sediminimonas]|uniref:MerR family transcriptional regulator n=1 Tax=Sediminimonas TaxID=659427 RepID=UPI0004025695|nr:MULTISPECIES: helix-turn-helix domain-containing protein [Sediminimonas]MDR9485324.1 helix-turn-helix domain-containing protein [Sediminimonas sp.]